MAGKEHSGVTRCDRDATLDVTGDVCPMTWVRTRLALEELEPGRVLVVRLNAGEAALNVPKSVKADGHRVLAVADLGDGTYALSIEKEGRL